MGDQLRKAYYKKSLKCHPDKNSSAEAAEEFHLLSEAYQVLSDDEKRDFYNKNGKEGMSKMAPKVEPSVFFNVILGCFLFEPYIGHVKISSFVEGQFNVHSDDAQRERKQWHRNGSDKGGSAETSGYYEWRFTAKGDWICLLAQSTTILLEFCYECHLEITGGYSGH